jgi:hypothetical protein
MTETCVSQILYELNGIWRAIMRKESDAVKRKYTQQVQDLRRQLVTKRAFDEEEAHKEITRLKKELQFLQRNLGGKVRPVPVRVGLQITITSKRKRILQLTLSRGLRLLRVRLMSSRIRLISLRGSG